MAERATEELHRLLNSRGTFGHREHLELAWIFLGMHSLQDAEEAMRSAIRHVALLHGAADRYHETLTRAWVGLVAIHRADSHATTFDEFIAAHPRLLDGALLDAHDGPGRLWGKAARSRWVAPDLMDLPTRA